MKMRHLRYFVAVAEELNFTRAAERLNTSQPSLSQQIRQLEHELRTPLFERNQRWVRLTPAGEVLLQEAQDILRSVRRAVERTRAAAKQTPERVRLGVIPAAELGILGSLLAELRLNRLDIEVLLISKSSPNLYLDLLRGEIDASFLRLCGTELRDLASEEFSVSEVARHGLVAVMSNDHPLASRETLTLANLAGHNLIGVASSEAPELAAFIEGELRRTGVEPHFAHTAHNVLTCLNMASSNLGIAVLPDYITTLSRDNLVYRGLGTLAETLPLYFAYRKVAPEALEDIARTLLKISPT